jgi:hypothetical protein
MQILYVWVTALLLCSIITVGWYISNTVVNTVASGNMDMIGTSGKPYSLLKLLEYVNIAWGPIFDFLVILWAIVSSAARDVTSDIYG